MAETQRVTSGKDAKVDTAIVTTPEDVCGYRIKANPRLVDRWLDVTVRVAGSAPIFLFIIAGLLTWALMGIRFGNSDVWVAAISDVQAILCYVFDSFLMRQLLREYSEQREAIVQIQSRCSSHQRMISSVRKRLGAEGIRRVSEKCNDEPLEPLGLRRVSLPGASLSRPRRSAMLSAAVSTGSASSSGWASARIVTGRTGGNSTSTTRHRR